MNVMKRSEFIRMLMSTSLCGMSTPWGALAGDFQDVTSWDPYVENIGDVETYLRRKFRQDVTDPTTGFSQAALGLRLKDVVSEGKARGEPWRITKAKCFAEQAMKMSIDVSPFDWFPAISVWNRRKLPIRDVFFRHAEEVNPRVIPKDVENVWGKGNESGDWSIWQDFDHSVPDWRVIVKLGFPGMKARLEKHAGAKVAGGGYADPFYESLRIVMESMLGCVDRFVAQGEKRLRGTAEVDGGRVRLEKEIACLKRLRHGPPQTAYDLLMFIWLYFMWSEHLDGIQCRSLTEIDVFLTPYYEADLAAGRTSEAEFREQFKHWLWQWGSISNYWNEPVGLGGTKADGTSEFNHVTKIVLDVLDECALTTPKCLVKVAPNTPEWAMDKMMDMARRHRSIAFIGEEPAAKALKIMYGASDEDCRTMALCGCYEFDVRDGVNASGSGHVNVLKPIERMLSECLDNASNWNSFADFKTEYMKRLGVSAERVRKITEYSERALHEVNPANLMSLSTEHALKTRKDGYANGCPRGNGSVIMAVGTGTAVDSLLAVKEIVYEKRAMTLSGLGKVMAENWAGHEELRLKMLRSKRKWGNNDPEANALGGEIVRAFAARVNGFPNARGGRFYASGHSARQFVELGAKTGATPDGRKAGEEMSKNLSPTMGADTEGSTALLMTLANSGTSIADMPKDYPLDVMMHPSACEGASGLAAMKAIVRMFHRNGGSVVQFTVFSAEELKDAQAHPDKYENLQVRVCGWNVRWNDLCKEEQDAYIRRAEYIMR